MPRPEDDLVGPEAESYPERLSVTNCAIRERTASGTSVGRCWHWLPDGKTCPRHGDVSAVQDKYRLTGELTDETRRHDARTK